ncbi:MAG: hypothetical protein ACJASR_000136 [Psychroserpens sp.]|jgi:hypothetical protein
MPKELPKQIEELSDKLCLKINEIENLTDELKRAEKARSAMQYDLAEILDTSGYTIGSKIALKNGRTIELKEFFTASIPSITSINKCKDPIKREELIDKKAQCLSWLDSQNLSNIIKNNIIANLPRGDAKLADEISQILEEREISFLREEAVNAMTLKATLKEHLSHGKNIPFDTFSVVTGTELKIK